MKKVVNAIIGVILFVFISNNIAAQNSANDSFLLIQLKRYIDTVEQIHSKWQNQKDITLKLSQGFCFINSVDSINASKLFKLFIYSDLMKPEIVHKFLLKNASCFTIDQMGKIQGRLNSELSPSDFHYHQLVSIFKLYSQIPYLKHHISDELFANISKEVTNEYLSGISKTQLKNYSTLANLGFKGCEDKVLSFVREKYDEVVSKEINSNWYIDLFYNSIPYLNSSNSVKETLYMLDDSVFPPPIEQHDVVLFTYAERYLISCVKPKLDNFEIETLLWNIKGNMDRIVELILNDDSIWADHVRVE